MSVPPAETCRMDSADHRALAARLDRLERENRRMKQAGSLALLSMAAVLVIAPTSVVKKEGEAATTTIAGPREIEAKGFVLVDPMGKKRATLQMTDQGPELSLLD
ncbi:MAG: hypothetical protein EHM35_14980, partial [Planctomycetaceae bacterium]